MDYPELIGINEAKKINNKKIYRTKLPLQKALEGYWVNSEGSSIFFKNERLYQGEYVFRYHINSIDKNKNYIHISVFGLKGFLIKDKKLFDIHIIMDDTKSNLKLKKIMGGGYTYNYNMIYIDDDNYKLGTFKSSFFNNRVKPFK
jgi:hypothetical protein